MLSQLNLRFPKKLIDNLKSRASAEETSVNALAGRFIEEKLMASAPDDDWLSLSADPDAADLSLYRKIVRGETFGRQALKPAELRWLFFRAHRASQTGSTYMSWPVMEALLGITFDALIYAAENGIPVDSHYINRAFDFKGERYRAETDAFMAAMPHGVDSTWAEFLLRPLSSGALNLEAFPEEAIARICTTERLKVIFPLLVRAREPDRSKIKVWAAATGLVTDHLSRVVDVADISLHMQITGNRFPQQPGGSWHAPAFGLFVTAGRVSETFDWNLFCALVRYMQARAWTGATHDWNGGDDRVSLFISRGASDRATLGLESMLIAMTPEEYLALEAALLEMVAAPDVAPVLAGLRTLYGDL